MTIRIGRPAMRLAFALGPDPDWLASSACHPSRRPAAIPAEWFTTTERLAEPLARELCERCPVRRACLEWAMDHHEAVGLWGGYTGPERRSLARRREHAAAVIAGISVATA